MDRLELARWTAYAWTRLTRLVLGMEAREWVERTTAEQNGRLVVVRIATKGQKLYRRAEITVDRLTDEIMSVCPAADLDRVRRSLQAMRGKLIGMAY